MSSCRGRPAPYLSFFFFNDTATTEIYTLSLHDALPICRPRHVAGARSPGARRAHARLGGGDRSEEHTSELQSRSDLVCRLLLEKKKIKTQPAQTNVSVPHVEPAVCLRTNG